MRGLKSAGGVVGSSGRIRTYNGSLNHITLRAISFVFNTPHELDHTRAISHLTVSSLIVRQFASVVNEIALCTVGAEILSAHVMVDAVVGALRRAKNDSTALL